MWRTWCLTLEACWWESLSSEGRLRMCRWECESLFWGWSGRIQYVCEPRALVMALQTRGESLFGQAVRWVTDSQSAVTILTVGSMKPWCHAVAVRVWDLAHAHNIRLSCVWMPSYFHRDHGHFDLSKSFDTSEYKLSRNDFGMPSQSFGFFCLDLVTSPFSYLFKPFCSGFSCKEAVAVDTFYNWLNEQLIELSRFCSTLVAAQWIESDTFRGKSMFDFLALCFRF